LTSTLKCILQKPLRNSFWKVKKITLM
jgi:hypothetical protein